MFIHTSVCMYVYARVCCVCNTCVLLYAPMCSRHGHSHHSARRRRGKCSFTHLRVCMLARACVLCVFVLACACVCVRVGPLSCVCCVRCTRRCACVTLVSTCAYYFIIANLPYIIAQVAFKVWLVCMRMCEIKLLLFSFSHFS